MSLVTELGTLDAAFAGAAIAEALVDILVEKGVICGYDGSRIFELAATKLAERGAGPKADTANIIISKMPRYQKLK